MSTSGSSKKYTATGSGRKYSAEGSADTYTITRGNTSDIGTPYPFSEVVVIEYLLRENGDFLLLESGDKIILD